MFKLFRDIPLAHALRVVLNARTRAVRCDTCPHWRPIGEQRVPALEMPVQIEDAPGGSVTIRQPERVHPFGACALEDLVMASYPRLGAAQFIRYAHDFCAKHPHHEAVPVEGLGYAPEGEIPPEKVIAGMSRPPRLHEARQLDPRTVNRPRLPADE